MSVFLQVNKGSTNVLSKYLEEKEVQNLEVVAFCEDISKWVIRLLKGIPQEKQVPLQQLCS